MGLKLRIVEILFDLILKLFPHSSVDMDIFYIDEKYIDKKRWHLWGEKNNMYKRNKKGINEFYDIIIFPRPEEDDSI